MSTKTTRAVVSVLVVAGALATVLFATMSRNADYYKNVDEVMPHAQDWYGKNLQLRGFVSYGSIEKVPDTLQYRFQVKNADSTVLANYTGIVPDTFKEGAEVVLKGRLHPDGAFYVEPNGVVAKCPSRYESQQTTLAPGAAP